jgi:hypothetical protein
MLVPKGYVSLLPLAAALVGCSAVGQLTMKDYTAKGGQRVMAGQAEPKREFGCQKLSQEEQEWGFKGNMDRAGAMERLAAAAVDAAPGKGANYAHLMPPNETSVVGINVNAFSEAQVAYYKCATLPPPK